MKFLSTCLQICYLRRKFAEQFADFKGFILVTHEPITSSKSLSISVLRMRNYLS